MFRKTRPSSCGTASISPASGVELLLQVELEVGVGGAGAVVGEPGVLVDQLVDVGGLHLGRLPPHLQHVLHDAVGAVAVREDASQVVAQVRCDLIDQIPLVLAQRAAGLLKNLPHFLDHLFRRLREVLDEVEGVADFVRDAGGQLPERRQLLTRDDLVLGLLQVGQHDFQLIVLALQLLRELFHQVEALHLVGVATEHLQGRGHVGHLVLADDLDRGLDVAFRHAPHAVGQLCEAT